MSYANRSSSRVTHSSSQKSTYTHSSQPRDELIRVFNSAFISRKTQSNRDLVSELYELTESAPFKAILNAVRHLSRTQGIQERKAAELIIDTFHKLDEVWSDYLFQEGLEQVKKPRGS